MNCFDVDYDDEQPTTLQEWLDRQRRELEAARGRAHAELDALFDRHARRMVLDAHRIQRDASNATLK